MSEVVTSPTKYIFLDVVGFSRDRSVEAQVDIIEALNKIVATTILKLNIPKKRRIFLPTGDGICIAVLNFEEPPDVHLLLALSIIKQVYEFSNSEKNKNTMRDFKVRVGLNANTDNLVRDINGKQNIAGAGINTAQRIMNSADGNQILVGESVYLALNPREKYMSSFDPFLAIDKHGKPIPVYQFKAEGATGLNTEVPSAFRNPDMNVAARACGLKDAYPIRNKKVKDDLNHDIENARIRVWLLGVGLSDEISLRDLLQTVGHKIKTIDVKILLLDGLRSPAVFRNFLESDLGAFKNTYKPDRRTTQGPHFKHPYFSQRLYVDFESAYGTLKEKPELKAAVRFYAHNPNCWLAIIDNTAYFQPYTFGGNIDQETRSIGSLLPVFKLQSEADVNVFNIVEDHFKKLWATSDADLFHVGARIEDRKRIIKLIFEGRKMWFKNVLGVLNSGENKSPGEDRRKYPRRPCESPIRDVTVSWGKGKTFQKINAEIIDFSCESARLKLKESTYPPKGKIVKLEIPPDPEKPTGMHSEMTWEMLAAKYLKEKLVEPTNGEFIVRQSGVDQSYIALQAYKKGL